MNKSLIFLLLILTAVLLESCKNGSNKNASGESIRIGDTSLFVTETDTAYLKNKVRDISKKEQDQGEIARMMVQVDSVKVADELEEFTASDSTINGFSIKFSDCEVTFDKLEAKALTEQNPETSRSVSYLVTKGDLAKIKIKVVGLQDISIKERIYTKLKVANGEEEYLLKSLGRKISDWFPLAGNKNIFISAGDNSFQFNNLTNRKLKIALDKELRARNAKERNIQEWMQRIKNTNDYTDAPCKLYVSSAQFRIKGKSSKGSVNKLIQFDIVE